MNGDKEEVFTSLQRTVRENCERMDAIESRKKRTPIPGVHTSEEDEGPAELVEDEDGVFLVLSTECGYNGTTANLTKLLWWLAENRPDLLVGID